MARAATGVAKKSTLPASGASGLVAASARALKLVRLGLRGDADLVLHLPLRYEDETSVTPIDHAIGGDVVQVEGVVQDCEVQYRPRRQLVVQLADGSGALTLRFLNFYGSQIKQMAVGTRLRVRGELRSGFFGREMVHPKCHVVEEGAPLPDRLTPVYPAGEGLSQTLLRSLITRALKSYPLDDTLPDALRSRYRLMPFGAAVLALHFPQPDVNEVALAERSHPAWLRMKFDELLAQQLSLKRAQQARRERNAPPLRAGGPLVRHFLEQLPFALTGAQQRVWREISADLLARYPMQRLLQGDVGSGKTVVAALAALQAIDNGYQAALMAPTEILADQHFRKLSVWIEALGVPVVWLSGSMKRKARNESQARVESGQARLIIGTHALIQDAVVFENLGLSIVDEQHRFGVAQRLALRAKSDNAGQNQVPHQLMMSATPIPRTLAMTYYADLEVSTIDELPPGRTPVVTRLIDAGRRDEVIARVHAAVLEGRQVYWVCPLIEESEVLQLQTAVDTHAVLSAALPDLMVGLIHGRLPTAEKAEVMDAFTLGAVQVLVSTTVIEVGVDVPNASLMVIEHAERFGLSQLHQLRGRVGRGSAASACILLYQTPLSPTARQRLRTMRETTDGFEIARRDLELRGPGEFLGQRQSGMALLRFADLSSDAWLVDQARDAAVEMLRDHPQLADQHLQRWMGGREEFLKA
jgi:ATP-dependent DNA helicase RecG